MISCKTCQCSPWIFLAALAAAAALAGCRGGAEEAAPSQALAPGPSEEVAVAGKHKGEEGKMGRGGAALALPSVADEASSPRPRRVRTAQEREQQAPEPAEPTRSWFPETFLFEPLLVTDEQGAATVEVRVPDRLTTWRVLALAHSRQGAQAGSAASFVGTLPVYVEPVVPPLLRVGDTVRLPLNLVNTTDRPVTAALQVSVEGADLVDGGAAAGSVTVAATGSLLRHVRLRASRPGQVRLLARLAGQDAVVRTIDVVPSGRPVTRTRSGTLAAPRELDLPRAAGAHTEHGQLRLLVYPGALSLLRSELAAAVSRGGLAEDAFALLLAGQASALLTALGDKPDPDALRDLAIVATQRLLRHARVLEPVAASLLAGAALAHPDNPVLARLGERAVREIAARQAPDGTCGGETGWTLQRLLVATADCARAAAAERRVVLRAAAAFDRHAERIADAYTAAAILASGAASFGLQRRLTEIVRAAIAARPDGSKVVAVDKGVVRADGQRPSTVEATALAILALEQDKRAPLADLGATILAGYTPVHGWGDGRANLVCLQAAVKLFREPIPDRVHITLQRDGTTLAEGTLDRKRAREVLVLEAPAGAASGTQRLRLAARPPIAGLGFSLTLTDRVPWHKPQRTGGVELSVTHPSAAAVGKLAAIGVRAAAPAGAPLQLRLALPAGVQVDRAHLDRLVSEGQLVRYSATDAELELHAAGQAPARVLAIEVRVIPTLAGSLQGGASWLRVGGVELHDPPVRWTIK